MEVLRQLGQRTLSLRRVLPLALVAVWLSLPASLTAHDGGQAFIDVPLERVTPGEPFPVRAEDFSPESVVELHIVREGRSSLITTVTAGADGHFETEMELSADFGHGPAEVVGLDEYGVRAVVQVLVSAEAVAAMQPAPPTPAGAPPSWADPSVVLLAAMVMLGVGALAWQVLKHSSSRPTPRQRRALRR